MSILKRLYLSLAYPDSPPCHAVLEPVVETGTVHTRFVVLLERVIDAFRLAGEEPPAGIEMTFTVFRHDGREVCRERQPRVGLGQAVVWESRTAVPREALPLRGTVLTEGILFDRSGGRVPEEVIEGVWGDKFASIVEFTSDWYEDGRFITTSHANNPVKTPAPPIRRGLARMVRALNDALPLRRRRTSQRTRPGSISVFDDGTLESSLFYFTWLQGIRPGEIRAELRNAEGQSLRAPLPALGPRSFASARLSALFPEARSFLGGRPGNLLLDRPVPLLTSNPRFYVQTTHLGSGGFGIDHAYLEHESSPRFTPLETWRQSGKGLHSPCVVVERPGSRTGIALFNMVDARTPKSIGILLYDLKGNLIVDKRPAAELGPGGLQTVWVRDLLDEARYQGDFLGHAEILYCMDMDPVPDMLHHQVLYVQPGMVEGVQVMVGSWNSPRGWRDDGMADPQDLGKRGIRAPAYADAEYETFLGLTNCSHAWKYDVDAEVEISLKAGETVVETAAVTIPPHGTWFDSVANLFPLAKAHLRPYGGIGVAEMRPTNVRTLGAQYFHVQRTTGHFSSEHTF